MKKIHFVFVTVLGFSILSCYFLKPERDQKKKESGPGTHAWFLKQRVFPFSGSTEKSISSQLRVSKNLLFQLALDPLNHHNWKSIGPTNIGGRITAISASSEQKPTIYLGTATGGVWKSQDQARSFQPSFVGLDSESIGAIAVDPRDPQSVWIGTGDANPSGHTYPGTGLYHSQNSGDDYIFMGFEKSHHISKIVLNPHNSKEIYIAVLGNLFLQDENRGVYRSKDGGETWEKVLFVSNETGAIDLVINPVQPEILYAAFWQTSRTPSEFKKGGVESGIYRSKDGGDHWMKLTQGLPDLHLQEKTGRIGISLAVSKPDRLYATFDKAGANFEGLYLTDDGGDHWKRCSGSGRLHGIYKDFGWWFGRVEIDPSNADRVFVLGWYSAESKDAGQNFKTMPMGHVDHHALYLDPKNDLSILGTDGGVYPRRNGQPMEHPELPITQFYSVAVDPSDPNRIFGGTQDNGTLLTTFGRPDEWKEILWGDGFQVLIDPTDSRTVFAESQWGALARSWDSGQSFQSIAPPCSRSGWNTPIRLSSENPKRVYLGCNKLFRSIDQGTTWSPISPEISTLPAKNLKSFDILQSGIITAFDVGSPDDNVIYIGTDTGALHVTIDGGKSWNPISSGIPQRWITQVRVQPGKPNVVFVTLSGFFWGSKSSHVFISKNFGQFWESISGNLPDVPVNSVLLDSEDENILYIGTDLGVYITRNLGKTWAILGSNLPRVPVLDLSLHKKTRALFAATHGRGIYQFFLY